MKSNVLLSVCIVILGWPASSPTISLLAAEPTSKQTRTDVISANGLSDTFREVAHEVSPGIVTVYALRGPRMTLPMRMRGQFADGDPSESTFHQHSISSQIDSHDDQGSGVIIDSRGVVLTCSHVVQDANAVFVRTADGTKFHAEKVICDPISDLAVILLKDTTGLHKLNLADSDDLRVGDWVISLASPYDMDRSVSAGIVSSTERWIPGAPYPLIQNDACTNPGSSGGALLNLRGEVVGIIEGAMTTTSEFQGIGLATPSNVAKDVADQLLSRGYVKRSYFGFQTQPLTPEMAKLLDPSLDSGLYVKEVSPGSPAALARLREGDIIIGLDGLAVGKDIDMQSFGSSLDSGQSHQIRVLRSHEQIEIDLQLRNYPTPSTHRPLSEVRCERCYEYFDASLGLGLSQLTPKLAKELKLPETTRGVLITHVAFASAAYREGVAAGMAITRLNAKPIRNIEDYQAFTANSVQLSSILLLLQSDLDKQLVLLEREIEKANVIQP